MKPSDAFKNTIKAYLDQRGAEDPLFAVSLTKEGKSLEDCITYILNAVKNSGRNGFTDDEIYGMAVHYYDEDKIDVGSKTNCQVVVNHTVELTEQEKQEARKKALDEIVAEERKKLTQKAAKPAQKQEAQISLF